VSGIGSSVKHVLLPVYMHQQPFQNHRTTEMNP